MNTKQKENTAKYLYDVSKGVLLIAVISGFFTQEFSPVRLVSGSLATILIFLLAYKIDGGHIDG